MIPVQSAKFTPWQLKLANATGWWIGGQRLLLDVESTFWVFWVGSVENQFSCLNYPAMGAKITAERLLDKAKLRRVG